MDAQNGIRNISTVLDRTRAKNRTVMLAHADDAAGTLNKQRRHHPELTLEDYRLLPRLIDQGRLISQPPNKVAAYAWIDGRLMRAVFKVTGNGELFLVSLHRAQPHNMNRDLNRGRSSGSGGNDAGRGLSGTPQCAPPPRTCYGRQNFTVSPASRTV